MADARKNALDESRLEAIKRGALDEGTLRARVTVELVNEIRRLRAELEREEPAEL